MSRFESTVDALAGSANSTARGFIIGGEFGCGKSHMLECLAQTALARNFAVSRVVVSKETPLSDLDLVYKAAVRELRLPDRLSGDLSEAVLKIDKKSKAYADFYRSVMDSNATLDRIFAATVFLHENLGQGEDFVAAIEAFWAGGPIKVSEVRAQLRSLPRYRDIGIEVKSRKAADLAPERFIFAASLLRAAGFTGWVILVDEVELVAKFPLAGRAKAYVNLMWLLGYGDRGIPHAIGIGAATKEFTGHIFGEKQDDINIPLKLIAKDPLLAERASRALDKIDEGAGAWESLLAQNEADLDQVYREVRELYRLAFDWEGFGAIRPADSGIGRSMRMHMRGWITRWDLERLDPSYSADIESSALAPDLDERDGLEGFSDPEVPENGDGPEQG